jgi:undecaprenyl-diphosphatase
LKEAAERLRRAGLDRLRSVYGALGLYLSLSLVAAILALLAFAELAEDVVEGDTERFDRAVLEWTRSFRTIWLDQVAIELTALGSGVVITVTTALLSVLLWHWGRRSYVALLWITGVGSLVLSQVLKAVFDRPRPDVEQLAIVRSLSFPSGHAMAAMVFYTVVAYVTGRMVGPGWGRTSIHAFGALVIVLVGWTRVYLGVHHPSDVLAGYTVGYAWAIFCCIAIERLSPRS